ncbi:MAG: aldolase [Sphingomonas sp.]|jgi:serine kinase of HPr protein (carbohydrate metabolism regulator)|nr:aldolase [Sphingomonas sp.]
MLLGPSGAGKSDLALRLIDRGALLVSDDYTRLIPTPSALLASAPTTIGGRLEIRGLGIVPTPHIDDVPVALAVRLRHDDMPAPDRMPERSFETFAGIAIRLLNLDPRPASAPILIEQALRHNLP